MLGWLAAYKYVSPTPQVGMAFVWVCVRNKTRKLSQLLVSSSLDESKNSAATKSESSTTNKVLPMQLTTGIDWEGNEIGGSGGSESYRRTNSRDGFRTQFHQCLSLIQVFNSYSKACTLTKGPQAMVHEKLNSLQEKTPCAHWCSEHVYDTTQNISPHSWPISYLHHLQPISARLQP